MSSSNKAFIINADKQTVIRQLILDVKAPLTTAQTTVNTLMVIQHPSATFKDRLNGDNYNSVQLVRQLDDSLTQIIDILDFYHEIVGSP